MSLRRRSPFRLQRPGAKTLYIELGSPWEKGYCESFNSKLRDEFLNGEIFYSMKELRVLAECWRVHYEVIRPHSSLVYRSPATEAWRTNSMGHGEVEIASGGASQESRRGLGESIVGARIRHHPADARHLSQSRCVGARYE